MYPVWWSGRSPEGWTPPYGQVAGLDAIGKVPLPYFVKWGDSRWQSGQIWQDLSSQKATDFTVYGIAYMELSGAWPTHGTVRCLADSRLIRNYNVCNPS